MTSGIILLLFFIVTFGLAWPLVARLRLDPAEKLCASAVLSLLGAYLVSFAIYVLNLPRAAFLALPALGVAGLLFGRASLAAVVRDRDARAILLGLMLIVFWCVGWLSLVDSYSGGGWTGDWFEHWQRARFFLEHWPKDRTFLEIYTLPARPPLANLLIAGFLGCTGTTFASYLVYTTLLNLLVFLPVALFARRFRPGAGVAAVATVTVLLMLNPSFVENTTFAWTKLVAACFILTGLYFFLRAHDPEPPRAAAPLFVASLATGLIAHYSAGPFAVLLAVAWFTLNQKRLGETVFWRRTLGLALLGAAILATWFGWSFATYGAHTTLLSNTSVTAASDAGNPLLRISANIRDTLVPHCVRNVDDDFFKQPSAWGYFRDWFFQLYQVNLFFIFGLLAWLVLARELVRSVGVATARQRWFWAWFLAGAIVLGIAVHGAPDRWGLAHICLQPLAGLGLAFLAARWPELGQSAQRLLIVGAAFDLCLGILLQFGVESGLLSQWFAGIPVPADAVKTYSTYAMMNLLAKQYGRVEFLADIRPVSGALVLALLAAILTLALLRAVQTARARN